MTICLMMKGNRQLSELTGERLGFHHYNLFRLSAESVIR